MLQVQKMGWRSFLPKHWRAWHLHTYSYLPSYLLNSIIVAEDRAHNCYPSVKTFCFTESSPSWSPFYSLLSFKKATLSHGRRASILTLQKTTCGSRTESHAQNTTQKYITLSVIMQYIYPPKRQTIAPVGNSIIFYFSIINFCGHQANKCTIPCLKSVVKLHALY